MLWNLTDYPEPLPALQSGVRAPTSPPLCLLPCLQEVHEAHKTSLEVGGW